MITRSQRNAQSIAEGLRAGIVIPAHPLALTRERKLDERHQRALTRYYLDAGAGGVALGVHTTQFAIREKKHGLLAPVLALAAETIDEWESNHGKTIVRIAGVIGKTAQAVREAQLARELRYQAALLSMAALPNASDDELIEHTRVVGREIPVMGFYLQPAVGGRVLSYNFWRRFVELDSVVAIKIAPFNRYQTLDVIRAVADAGAEKRIALYTGNDDNILLDLLTTHQIPRGDRRVGVRMVGGLLGHWAFWTRNAVKTLARIKRAGSTVSSRWLKEASMTTEANAAVFDAANNFNGCIPGINEVLRRQGLLRGNWCLDPREELSRGQSKEIDRVCRAYPQLTDDEFVRENLDRWLR